MVSKGAKIGIIVFILVGLSVAIYFAAVEYRKQCPDGLMVCLGLEDGPTKDPAPETTTPTSTPATVPAADRSPDYAECTRYFDEEDKTKTCYDPANGKGGLRWFWSNTAGGKTCLNKTQFYKIEASSALDDHKMKYTYVKPGGNANGIIFTDASRVTKKGTNQMNMKFNITPLDKDKKALSNPLIGQELNPGDNTTDCSGIGVAPVKFFDVFKASTGVTPSPPPPPVGCVGDWEDVGECVSGPYCGDMGTITQKFKVIKQPQHGGQSCPSTEKSVPCVKKAPCLENPLPPDEQDSCEYGVWQDEQIPRYLGVTQLYPDNDPVDGTTKSGTTLNVCTKPYRDGPNDPPGKRKQFRSIRNVNFVRGQQTIGCIPQASDIDGTEDDFATERTFDCNENTYKPIDCVEGVVPDPTLECWKQEFRGVNRSGTLYNYIHHAVNKHVVTEEPQHGGKACTRANGTYMVGDELRTEKILANKWKNHSCDKLPSMTFP